MQIIRITNQSYLGDEQRPQNFLRHVYINDCTPELILVHSPVFAINIQVVVRIHFSIHRVPYKCHTYSRISKGVVLSLCRRVDIYFLKLQLTLRCVWKKQTEENKTSKQSHFYGRDEKFGILCVLNQTASDSVISCRLLYHGLNTKIPLCRIIPKLNHRHHLLH